MKKTTLLIIGALVLVFQATAQTTIYQEDFESQVWGATPQNWDGNNMWAGGGGGANSYTVGWANNPAQPMNVQASLIAFDTTTWGSYWSGQGTSWVPGPLNSASTITMSIDLAFTGNSANDPVDIWLEQDWGGSKMAASYCPSDANFTVNGQWVTVTFTLDQAVIQQSPSQYLFWNMGQQININPCQNNGIWAPVGNVVATDNYLMVAQYDVPEPGTIALLTLGGLGALVAIRRRRA